MRSLVLVALLGAVACIPFPRRAVVVPGVHFDVRGADGGALPGAGVTVVRYSYPHARVEDTATSSTGAQGRAAFEQRREWEAIWPLLPHGIPFYEFAWCVEAPSHHAAVGPVTSPATPVMVHLNPGATPCPDAGAIVSVARFGAADAGTPR